MESNVILLLCYFLHLGRACLFVFNIKNIYFTNVERAFLHRSEMNTPQAGGKVNARLYSGGRRSNLLQDEYDAGEESSALFRNN